MLYIFQCWEHDPNERPSFVALRAYLAETYPSVSNNFYFTTISITQRNTKNGDVAGNASFSSIPRRRGSREITTRRWR